MDTQNGFASGYSEAIAARRLMNDSIASSAERLGGEALVEFFCECADAGCKNVVHLTVEQFRLCRSGAVIGLHPRRERRRAKKAEVAAQRAAGATPAAGGRDAHAESAGSIR